MIEKALTARLRPIGRRYAQVELLKKLTICWTIAAAGWVVLVLLARLAQLPLPYVGLLLLGATVVVSLWLSSRVGRITNYKLIARKIEEEDPQLQSLLLAAVEQQPDSETGQMSYLQERVITEALEAHGRSRWGQRIEQQLRILRPVFSLLLIGTLFLVLFLRMPAQVAGHPSRRIANLFGGIEITPGDASIERGSMVAITARFGGSVPPEVKLVTSSSKGTNLVPVSKSLDDPLFGATLASVPEDTLYHFEYGNSSSKQFVLRVFDFPELQKADAQLTYPTYTKLAAKTITDTRRITAVQGTKLDYVFQLNKPVRSAKLIAKDKSVLELMAQTNQPNLFHTTVQLVESKHYDLELVDTDKRTNKVPAEFVFEVLTNAPPTMKLASPRGDVRVSPLEELLFEGEVSDDFALGAYGVAYKAGGGETHFIQLGEGAPALEKKSFKFTLPLEDLKLRADDLVSYYVWAEDSGPDGSKRRNSGDIFFAEVRPFDEIFRQAPEQPESASNANAQPASKSEKLAELQKQIISATWNTLRRETGAKPSAQYPKDAELLRSSQAKALTQVEQLKENIEDAHMRAFVDAAGEEMIKAVKGLKAAEKSPTLLNDALAFEQTAYQALLKLQAREYSVSRNKGQKGSGSGEQSRQRELDQLDLKDSDNRYETQRKATPQNAEQREQSETLNRLKELARRQQDVNDRLQELQTALQEAKTEPERQKLRDQLKRLREEQRDIVKDVDQLQQRMSQSPNKDQMADAQRKLDETRREAQKAAENLQNDSVSKALASGARAQQDLKELQEDFRKNSSARFSEEMREMRNQARQLADQEKKIAGDLETMTKTKQRTLSDNPRKQQLTQALDQQKSGLTNLLQQMQQVTEQSETAEPLLSKQLYDTLRKANQQDTQKSLDMASTLVDRSLLPQASKFEEQARKTINDVKGGVERAAESVLGDEAEALRTARKQVDELTSKLEREIASAAAGATNSGGRQLAQNLAAASEEKSAEGQEPKADGKGQSGKPGDKKQPGEGDESIERGSKPGSGKGKGQDVAQAQNGSPSDTPGTEGESGQGKNGKGGKNPGGQAGQGQAGKSPRRTGLASGARLPSEGTGTGPNNQEQGPLTGSDFRGWSDRLSEVEEMVDNPGIRNDLARVQDRARAVRSEFKNGGKKPDWAVVRSEILSPLVEVRRRIDEELSRKQSDEAMVPLDRDAIPAMYTELVRRYYENLGK
ncbi:MAG: hypothetical protein JWM99_1208 [Verrucomicrobiales bacterium]|nr:hypothetical protein [Verrucomicrobiales bacterium]